MANSRKKNLIASRDVYNKYYGDFRGVDFSSDHAQVIDRRFAYSVNMYKDYLSGQGGAIETIPGFRMLCELYGIVENVGGSDNINGIHPFTCEIIDQSEDYDNKVGSYPYKKTNLIFIHCGCNVYCWLEDAGELFVFDDGGENKYASGGVTLKDSKSKSFVFNNRLYILDGENMVCFNSFASGCEYDADGSLYLSGLSNVSAYIPTTYINIKPAVDNGMEKEHLNLLSKEFINTFIADGTTNTYVLNYKSITISTIYVYGKKLTKGQTNMDGTISGDYAVSESASGDTVITFKAPPAKPEAKGYPSDYAGVVITATFGDDFSAKIKLCNNYAIFDNRVFLTGNPNFPNRVYFCGMHDGYADPTYFPEVNYFECGVSNISGITGMLPVSDSLMILKNDSVQDGTVYYYKPVQTGDDLYPVRYEGTKGLSGLGCLGACINFLDDPVFISRLGVEAIGQLSVRLERAVEHRSSLIDAKLVNLKLANAVLEEWNGYLVLLVDGKIFLADSRQRYTHETGVMQYEWYYLEDIGVYNGQYKEYQYATDSYGLDGDNITIYAADESEIKVMLAPEALRGKTANPPNEGGKSTCEIKEETVTVSYGDSQSESVNIAYVSTNDRNYLCTTKGNYIGGWFSPAITIKSFDNNLFFGTADGHFCAFNFDKRNENGEIPIEWYSFNGRTINCGVATKMDNCGIPHLTKNTVKKSTVIKTKTFQSSAAKIKVRTNNEPYKQIDRINSGFFSFENVDFQDFTFETSAESLFSISEKEKRWVEKQYYIYSDEYQKPFALYNISYRYLISGRYKN